MVSYLDTLPLVNIGLQGLGFATVRPPDSGNHVLLSVFLPDEPVPLVLRGLVAWVGPREDWSPYSHAMLRGRTFGVGVRFAEPETKLADVVAAVWRELYREPQYLPEMPS